MPYEETGTFSGNITVNVAADTWKSVCYDIKVGGAGGGAHFAGNFYDNGSISNHNQTVNQYAGSLGALSISPNGQEFRFSIPISAATIIHPVVVMQLTCGGNYQLKPADIEIDVD